MSLVDIDFPISRKKSNNFQIIAYISTKRSIKDYIVYTPVPGDGKFWDGTGNDGLTGKGMGQQDGTMKTSISRNFPFFFPPVLVPLHMISWFAWIMALFQNYQRSNLKKPANF
jgi:hypothetical protein